jgi:hypothetical protein
MTPRHYLLQIPMRLQRYPLVSFISQGSFFHGRGFAHDRLSQLVTPPSGYTDRHLGIYIYQYLLTFEPPCLAFFGIFKSPIPLHDCLRWQQSNLHGRIIFLSQLCSWLIYSWSDTFDTSAQTALLPLSATGEDHCQA